MAYGRFLLAKSGVRFSDAYQRMLPGACLRSVPFRLNLFGTVALAFARAESQRGISVKDFFAVAGRSAEFQAANQLLNKVPSSRTWLLDLISCHGRKVGLYSDPRKLRRPMAAFRRRPR
jgi:hypothetical protein